MIKGKSPFPFETICLAVSFSPGISLLVEETKRLCELHDSMAVFIHVGKKTGDKQRELSAMLSSCGFNDTNSRIYWEPGEVVATILRICKHEVVDLLITGASDKEEFKFPMGQTSSQLATKAKCSVLIYNGRPTGSFKKLVINGTEHRKTDLTILTAIYFAGKENIPVISVVDENDSDFMEAGTYTTTTGTRSVSINRAMEKSKVSLKYISLMRENCTSASDYAFKENADLLISYSSDHHLLIFDRVTANNSVEGLLRDTPCNLLIVHSRIRD